MKRFLFILIFIYWFQSVVSIEVNVPSQSTLDISSDIQQHDVFGEICDESSYLNELETVDCNNLQFNCSNHDINGIVSIAYSKVNDGICDCCDCSDELNTQSKTYVSCDKTQHNYDTLILEEYRKSKNGYKKSQTVVAEHELLASLKKVIQKLSTNMKKLKTDVQNLYNQYQRQPSLNIENKFNKKRSQYTLSGQEYMSLNTYISLNQFNYLNLTFSCYKSRLFNELEIKGGSTNYVYKDYVIVFCPYRYVNQIHSLPSFWEERNNFVKNGGSIEESQHMKNHGKQEPEITNLGYYSDTQYIYNYFTNKDELSDIYVSTTQCLNGQNRYTYITYTCGTSNKILHFYENGMCIYYLLFQTPLACTDVLTQKYNEYLIKNNLLE